MKFPVLPMGINFLSMRAACCVCFSTRSFFFFHLMSSCRPFKRIVRTLSMNVIILMWCVITALIYVIAVLYLIKNNIRAHKLKHLNFFVRSFLSFPLVSSF